MGKKAKEARRERYKAFMDGMLKHRKSFLKKKFSTIESLLENPAHLETLKNKDRSQMNQVERAALDVIVSKKLEDLESFQEKKDEWIANEEKSATFRYTPKKY